MTKVGSLTSTINLEVERLGIVFVEDVGGNIGSLVVNHRCYRKLGVGEGEELEGFVGQGLKRRGRDDCKSYTPG